jgi:hypothetical protein
LDAEGWLVLKINRRVLDQVGRFGAFLDASAERIDIEVVFVFSFDFVEKLVCHIPITELDVL